MQLPRYMGIETSSCQNPLAFYHCNFLVIWGLKQLDAVIILDIAINCNFLVIWGLKHCTTLPFYNSERLQLPRYMGIETWGIFVSSFNPTDLLQLPRYMGIETRYFLIIVHNSVDCNFLVIWGLKHEVSIKFLIESNKLQLPRYMGIETVEPVNYIYLILIATSSLYGD